MSFESVAKLAKVSCRSSLQVNFKRFAVLNVVSAALMTTAVADTAQPAVAFQKSALSTTIDAGVQVYEWKTKAPRPRGTVVAVHGTTQQAGCFESLSRYLNDAGFNVIAMDLRGHGRSYFSHDPHNARHDISYTKSADDLARVSKHIKSLSPRLPLFCIGESVGAGVVVRAASEHPDIFDGIILAAAGTSPHFFSFDAGMIAHDLVKGLSDLDRPLDVADYIRKYSSDDPRVTKEMVDDPLSRTMLTGKEILQTGAFIHKTPHQAKLLASNISVLLINGNEDGIVKADSTQAILNNIRSRDKKMINVPGCGHVLLGTSYLKKAVVSSVTDWLIYETNTSQTASLHKLIQ
jgi:alpha-beta hydrolase superfamily lysophospholipase